MRHRRRMGARGGFGRTISRITKLKKPVRHIAAHVEHANHTDTVFLCEAPEHAYPLLASIRNVTCQKCLEEVVRREIQS